MVVILYILLLFLSVVGLCDLIHSARLSFLRFRSAKGKILVLKLKDKFAEFDLRYVIEQYNWSGSKYADRVIAISYLDDDALEERCKTIAGINRIEFIKESEFINTEL